MKLKNKRKMAQITAFAVSNLGFLRILKTGFICPFLYCHGCLFAAFGCPIGILQSGREFIIYGQGGALSFTIGSLGVYGTIFGRAFCGWACPFGTLHDVLNPTNRRSEVKTRNYWYVKYAILFLALALAWFALDTIFCKFCPSGSLFASIPYPLSEYLLYNRSLELRGAFYIHMFTLALTIVSALLVSRFWCRYLCPMGAIAGAFNKVSIVSISLDEEKCKKCDVCLEACGMGITKQEDIGGSTDCILCGALRLVLKKLYVSQEEVGGEDDVMRGKGELKFIGIVEVAGEKEARVQIFPEFCDALKGIDGFSHIIILYWFHLRDNKKERSVLRVVPRRHTKNVQVGVFACRSPSRPNPVGLCVVKLRKVEDCILTVKGLDALEGSPIIDIKPYILRADAIPNASAPEWTLHGPPT